MFVLCRHLSTFTVNSAHVSSVGLNKLLPWELTLGRSTRKLASSPSPKILQRRRKRPYSFQAQGTLLICFRGFLLLLQVCCRCASRQPALQQGCGVVPDGEEVWSHWPALSLVGVHGAVLFLFDGSRWQMTLKAGTCMEPMPMSNLWLSHAAGVTATSFFLPVGKEGSKIRSLTLLHTNTHFWNNGFWEYFIIMSKAFLFLPLHGEITGNSCT